MAEHKLLTISEMAYIHGITRTTLIYYDKIGLFQPETVDENGYRYYSPTQIPMLREICFLRSIGISLDDIKLHNKHKSSTYTFNILYQQQEKIEKDIAELQRRKELIQQRVSIYQNATEYAADAFKPTIEYLPRRYAVIAPWDQDDISLQGLNRVLMETWRIMESHDILPCQQWGSIIWKKYLDSGNPLQGACTYSLLPEEVVKKGKLPDIENLIVIPEGYYACCCKYAMPYQWESTEKLIHWIHSQGYEITGDLVDACLLEVVFYERDDDVDFCQIQIPIHYEERQGDETQPPKGE